jgi:SAM-dependent methyltransferase
MVPARQDKIDQKYLDIDAGASTVITRYDGDLSKLSFLKTDVVNSAYLVRPVEAVAVVGVGGGRDILSAMFFGAKKISGIEINPAIFEVLEDKFASFSGHLDSRPGVSLVNAEARGYINRSTSKYDLVQISLIDTWAATAAGGLTLTENRLYTRDAWTDFYRALKPGGMLSVSRWYNPRDHRGEFYRLVAIAADALTRHGVPPTQLNRHVIALNVDQIVTVITSPDAFTDSEWAYASAAFRDQGFKILLGPDVAFDSVTSTILSGKANEAYFSSLPEDISPSTDNKPFFFYTSRLGDLARRGLPALPNVNSAVATTFFLVVAVFLACVFYVVIPVIRLAHELPGSTIGLPVLYFSAIGMGFMLIEISQMQRLMVFLGHPVYGLGVVLFTLLMFSGLGSTTVRTELPSSREVVWRVLGLIVAVVVIGLLTSVATHWARSEDTDMRILLSVLLLAPPAFLMGMMFPLGLSTWRRHTDLLPFFWTANGMTSVFASVVGVALSMELGIVQTYAIGAVCYLVSGSALLAERRHLMDHGVEPINAALIRSLGRSTHLQESVSTSQERS